MNRTTLALLTATLTACKGARAPELPPIPGLSEPAAPSPRTLVRIELDTLPEERARASLRPTSDLNALISTVEAVATDGSAGGLFLEVGPLGRGAARADELVDALQRVRDAHKPVHCHFEVADNLAYSVLARGCDRITMTPAGHLLLMGVAAHLQSVRGLLTWLGVEVDAVQAGVAKGAADPFVRDEPSPEHRANIEQLVARRQQALLRAVATRARTTPEVVAGWLAEAPFTSSGARARGLVDDVEFDDEAREHARVAAEAERVEDRTPGREPGPRSLTELLERLSAPEASEVDVEQPRLAVVRLSGAIVDGGDGDAESAAADPFVAHVRRLTLDDSVRAVVLRIDSPGGSALASDRMWHAVHRLSERKPVVVSVGDMAASGGYYIACAAREILADEGSIVGSIGVVAGRPNLAPLLERVGVRTTTIAASPSADLFVPFRAMRADERARFEASAAEAYGRFLERIRTRRPGVQIPDAAEGRVFVGEDARALGLVDGLGTMRDALGRARTLGGLDDDAPVDTWPRTRGLLEAFFGGELEAQSPLRLDPALRDLVRSLDVGTASRVALPQAALPYDLHIE